MARRHNWAPRSRSLCVRTLSRFPSLKGKRRRERPLRLEGLEPRLLLSADWRNPVDSLDVNGDGLVTPIDALVVINHLNQSGAGPLPQREGLGPPWLDSTGDNFTAPIDVLLVINALNSGNHSPFVLRGDQRLAIEKSALVTLGQQRGARTYRFQIDAAPAIPTGQSLSEDMLAVYLVDPQDRSRTLLDRGEPGTALFTLSGSRAEFVPGQVRFDGSVVEVDLTSLGDLQTGRFIFQLLSLDRGTSSQFTIRPLSNEVDGFGEERPILNLSDRVTPAGDPLDVAGLSPVDEVELLLSNVHFSPTEHVLRGELTAHNLGSALARRMAVVFPELPDGVTLRNATGLTPGGHPYLNLEPSIASGGLGSGGRSDAVLVEFDNPQGIRFPLRPQVLAAGPNRAPVLQAIASLSVMPGATLTLPLVATDPDGDGVMFSMTSSDPLPTGRLAGDGTLSFRPRPDELGRYEFTVIASDGMFESSQNVVLDVIADPVTTTRVSGRVLDVDQTPLGGMQVELGGVQGLTQTDGSFVLDVGMGPLVSDTLKIRGETFSDPTRPDVVYPFIAEKLPLVLEHEVFLGVNNVIERPIFLPKLDVAGGREIDPTEDVVVTTDAIPGVAVSVAAGTLMTQQGTPFTGVLSVTEVPRSLTPAALPPGLLPDLVVTIQPGEMVFATPAPLTLPNRSGWEPGTLMDLWSINPVTGEFDDVGEMRVSDDGSVMETISGGIRNSSWHFGAPRFDILRVPDTIVANKDEQCMRQDALACATSFVELHSGAVLESHDLVGYQSLGELRGLTLHYHSQRADPRPIVHFGIDNPQTGDDRRLVARLSFSDGQMTYEVPGFEGGMGLPGGEHFWRIPAGGGSLEVALQADLSSLPSGTYQYSLTVGNLRISEGEFTGATSNGSAEVVHVNSIRSEFGAGWELGGIQQLVENPDGTALLIDGGGMTLQFEPLSTGTYQSPAGDFSNLVKNADGTFTRTMTDRTVYRFDADGRLTSMTDRNGNATQLIYQSGRLVRIVDPVGLATVFGYTGSRVSTITDPAGRVTRLQYDAAGNLTRITDPDGATRTFQYDELRHMVAEVDQLGRRERAVYGFHGRATSSIRKDGSRLPFDPLQTRVLLPPTATIDPQLAPLASPAASLASAQSAQANGNVTTTMLDQAGQAVRSFDAVGDLGSVARDGANQVSSLRDGRGFLTSMTYDERGNRLTITDGVTAQVEQGGAIFPGETFLVGQTAYSIATGDFNGDGLIDLALAIRSTYDVAILLGNGDATFQPPRPVAVGNGPRSVIAADLDGDGILDLATANSGSDDVSVLLGRGDGTFNEPRATTVGSRPVFLTVEDFDGDDVADLAVVNELSHDVSVLLGNGDGTFRQQERVTVGTNPVSMATGDFNGDGAADMAVANSVSGGVSVRLGNGDGTFGEDQRPGTSNAVSSVVIDDFNGDGLPDLAAANSGFGRYDVALMLGKGDGTFEDEQRFDVGTAPRSMIKGDFNGDGVLDLATGNRSSYDISVLLGNDDGSFQQQRRLSTGNGPYSLASGDFDGDGASDLVVSTGGSNHVQVLRGRSDGSFMTQQAVAVGTSPKSVVLADFNGDGQLDMAVANYGSYDLSVRLGTGDGGFGDEQRLAAGNGPFAVAAGDFNGDGMLDLAAANKYTSDVSVRLGRGDGTFGDVQTFSVGSHPVAITSDDFNGDGILDLAVVNRYSRSVSVLLGRGDGSFGTHQMFGVGSHPRSVAAGDFNGDGILDLAVANGGPDSVFPEVGDISVLIGRGDGTFRDERRFTAGLRPRGITSADLNGDRILDLAVANFHTEDVAVYLGDGQGSFGPPAFFGVGSAPFGVAAGDINGDGVLDLAVANGSSADVSLLLGRGDGTFRAQRRFAADVLPYAVALGDLNGDGMLDLAVTNIRPGTVSILMNQGGSAAPRVQPARLEYDAVFSQVSGVTDETGRQTLFDIDPANGNQRAMRQVVGRIDSDANGETDDLVTRYSYTARGLIETMTDPLGRVTAFGYDLLGRLTAITVAVGTADQAVRRFEYDVAGNQTEVIDENGNRTEFEYDAMNRLIRIVEADPDGPGPLTSPITQFAYDDRGNLVETRDAKSGVTTLQYDSLDRQTRARDPLGQELGYTYDRNGNMLSATDANGHVTRYEYDARNRPTRIIDAQGGVTTFRYDSDDNPLFVTDPRGNRTSFAYDARNRLIREVDALGQDVRLEYNAADDLVSRKDRNGNSTRFEYDAVGRETARIDALGGVKRFEYDAASNLVATIDELGRRTQLTHDARNRLLVVTNPLGNALRFDYDTVGNVTSITDALNRATRSEYDALNRRIRVTDPLDGVRTYAYDANHNVTSTTDELGRTVRFEYDALNRQTRVIDPLDQATQAEYDAIGNVTRVTDRLGQVTRFVYDTLNRQTQSIDARGGVTRMDYDAVGNLTRVADPMGNATTFAYDTLNRLITETNALGDERQYGYDPEGNLTSLVDRNFRRREFEYDALNRRTEESWPGFDGNPSHTFTYEFDAAGQLVSASDPSSSYSYVYDAGGRMTSVTNAGTPGVPEVVFTYAYDTADNPLSRSETIDGVARGVNAYQYDDLNRLTRITQSGPGVAPKRADLSYDAAGQMTSVARFADLAGTQSVATSTYTFDLAGRLKDLVHATSSATIAQYAWTFDAGGRITRMTSNDGTTDYNYDSTNQLLAANHSFQTDESYSYDLNGNRTNPGHQTETNNRLVGDGTYSYEYDAEGNRTRRTNLASRATTDYQWDFRNRLVRVTDTSAGGVITHESTYNYDVYDRRIVKSVDLDGAGPNQPIDQRFVYDGHHIALTFDKAGAVTHRYLHGPSIDQIFADEHATGEVLWPLADLQGTVRDVVGSNSNILNHLKYDSFGTVTEETNPSLDFSFGFTGRERDKESGLWFYRARYYDSQPGRFISEDPIGFHGRDTNLSRYVGNSPTNSRDPLGLRNPLGLKNPFIETTFDIPVTSVGPTPLTIDPPINDEFLVAGALFAGGVLGGFALATFEVPAAAYGLHASMMLGEAPLGTAVLGFGGLGAASGVYNEYGSPNPHYLSAAASGFAGYSLTAASVVTSMGGNFRFPNLPNVLRRPNSLTPQSECPRIYTKTSDIDKIFESGRIWGRTEGSAYGMKMPNAPWWRTMANPKYTNPGVIEFEGQAATLFRPHAIEGPYAFLKRTLGQFKAPFGDLAFRRESATFFSRLSDRQSVLVVRDASVVPHAAANQSTAWAYSRLWGRRIVIEGSMIALPAGIAYTEYQLSRPLTDDP